MGGPLMGRGSQNAQATASAPPRAGAIPEPELAFALASAMPGRLPPQISAGPATAVFRNSSDVPRAATPMGASQLPAFPWRPPREASRPGCAQSCTQDLSGEVR